MHPKLERAARLAVAHRRLVDSIDDLREARDRAIIDCVDAGLSTWTVSRVVDRSQMHIRRIVAADLTARQTAHHGQAPDPQP